VNFKNTIIIMTSNLGAQYIDRLQKIGFHTEGNDGEYGDIKDKVMEALKDHFRPEFLNRIDDTIVFDVLPPTAIASIVQIQIDLIKERLIQKEISLDVTPAAMEQLSKEGYNPQFGARPLKRIIQTKILNQVASLIISKGILKGGSILVDSRDGQLTFDIKKGRKGSIIQQELIAV
jgi:ATP-dependent Clp protease ATP-binding subunit ClpC